ncbi:IclR family transcriptional regulator [Bacillus sp. OK048]|uniref:IclR family transcriptional regulator n=1 Tax=Bacillus sp. OK048 TaxID=1882761 RepID=UPI0020C8AE5F|nr:IclR family transcriptional regulator [Bacillus sp. OK048]
MSTAKPYLQKLSKEVNETIHLCIEDQGEIVYIDKIESNQSIQMYSRIGSRAPMHSTGVGKVILSDKNQQDFEKLLSKMKFVRRTPTTITSKEEFVKEIEKVKVQGYALDNVENEEVIRCIASPIFDHKGKIIASFSISGPSNRVTMEYIESTLIDKVKTYTKEISRNLGYTGSRI